MRDTPPKVPTLYCPSVGPYDDPEMEMLTDEEHAETLRDPRLHDDVFIRLDEFLREAMPGKRCIGCAAWYDERKLPGGLYGRCRDQDAARAGWNRHVGRLRGETSCCPQWRAREGQDA